MGQDIKLRVSNINKSFPGVKALDNMSLDVKKGSVHVICGENGAGKSTLMKIINGVYHPDSGEIYIDGNLVKINNPMDARQLGISMIFQEMNYIPDLTVEENLILGDWPISKIGKIRWKDIRRKTTELLKSEGLSYSPTDKLSSLSVSDIQMLEITKAVSRDCGIIIMDEPTSAITQSEVKVLFDKIRDLKQKGVSIIYISHKLDEIFQIADEITVIRDGTWVDTKPASELRIDQVIHMMVGRELSEDYPKVEMPIGDEYISVKNLSGRAFRDVSFNVRKGEIVGIAGLMGAGRTEVARAIFGLDPINDGNIYIEGEKTKIEKVQDSINHGIAMLSEDRRRYGIVPVRSVKENCTLASLEQVIYGGRAHTEKERGLVSDIFNRMNVKTPTLETPIMSLSGGNQQKVLLSRWMLKNPNLFIMDEPTRGIDVGAKYEIYNLITELVETGKSVVMISSEMPELIGMCDRIYVMCQGTINGVIERSQFSQELIMEYATGMRGQKENKDERF